jgi:predicted Co/Zn/Cd cation transporter (cation efflux family)
MVLVSCALLVGSPIAMIRGTVVELLEGAPGADIMDPIIRALDEVRAVHGFDEPELYVAKVGPKLYVEVAASADADMTIAREQTARDQLKRLLEPVPYDIWLTLELRPRPPGTP